MGRKTRYAGYKMRSVSAKSLHDHSFGISASSDSSGSDFEVGTGTPDTKNPLINVIYNKQHRKR